MENKYTTNFITRTAILLALALIFQIGLKGIGQPLVGPLVNFVLIISACTVSTLSGVIIGTLTPIIAFILGVMGFLPVVPFIIVGNILYVVLFNLISKKVDRGGDVFGIVLSSLTKYAFLALSIRYIVVLFAKVPPKMVAVFSLPQLYNALIGGVLALIVKAFLPNSMFLRS